MTTITTRAGKGSPLLNSEVDANFTNLNDDKVETSGDSMTGDLSFGDNNKVILGTGNDLQLYHDGSASYIDDSGAGDLVILSSARVRFEGKSTGDTYMRLNENSSVQIYHDNTARLTTTSTGIDVTGTATMDGLTVDGTIASPSIIKISNSGGTWTPGDEIGRIQFYSADGSGIGAHEAASIRAVTNQGGVQTDGTLEFWRSPYNSSVVKALEIDGATGDILSYADDGTTEGMRWDASTSRLGIGTPSPDYALNLEGSEATILIHNTTGSPDQALMILQADMGTNNRNFQIKSPATDSSADPFRFVTGNSFAFEIDTNDSAFVIDSNANVGIGITDPDAKLNIATNSNTIDLKLTNTQAETAGSTDYNVNMKAQHAEEQFTLHASDTYRGKAWIGFDRFGQEITFGTGASGTQKMVIAENGDVGIGTSPDQRLHIYDSNCIFKMEHFANNTSRIYFSSTTDGDWGAINATNTSGARTITITPNSATGDSRYGGLVLGQNEATIGGVFDTDYGLNVYGDVGVGTTDITDSYKMIIEGSDQETANLTDAGTHGATLFLRALGENVGSGGAVAFGTTNGNKRPFAAIKGYVLDGTANSVGDLVFSTRATTSATALTERMTLTNSGRLVIGVNSAQGKLDVQSDGQYTPAAYFRNDGNATGWARADWYNDQASGSGIVYRDQAGSFVFRNDNSSGTAMTTRIVAGGTTAGNIIFNKDATSGGEVARFDTSGNFLVGKESAAIAGAGTAILSSGTHNVTVDGDTTLQLNRLSSPGPIATFFADGGTVGSIGTLNSALTIGTGDTGIQFNADNNAVMPHNITTGANVDASIDIGYASGGTNRRFKNLYLSGGVYLGGTLAANKLNDYEKGTFTGAVADASSGGNQSSSVLNGTYVKIGAVVYAQFNVSNISTTGMTPGNNVFITGLPFAAKSVSGTARYTGTANLSVVTFEQTPIMQVNEGETFLKIVEIRSGAGNDSVTVSQLSSGASDIHGSLVYQTD